MPLDLLILFRVSGPEVDRDGLVEPPEVPLESHGSWMSLQVADRPRVDLLRDRTAATAYR
jgi:hypothetical protein